MIENSLWVEMFRPNTLDGYIGNEFMINKFRTYIANNDMQHLLLHGPAGTGKTTAAKILAKGLDADILYINASDENNIDTVRDKIKGFASSMGMHRWKIVILDEADYLTTAAQAALRNLMETFSGTCRFILTCNYIEKILAPIRSRCQEFTITPPDKKSVAMRLKSILDDRKIKYELADLVHIIDLAYPDIRKVINTTQSHVLNGELKVNKNEKMILSYMDSVLVELKSKTDMKAKFKNVRQIIADSRVKDFTSLYRFLFDNLDDFATGHVAGIILLIADAQYKDSFVVDKEVNVMAMFVNVLNELNTK